ncbi:beta/gamma crystallin-related protein [Nostoc sp. PCC 9305]|uniref:beta/gamma crystallin-related protein n=1 Tax=Nostoc sp. PCC 9305 TaxID=296636 RepID=UPI0039C6C702
MSNINNNGVDMNNQTLTELSFSAVKEINDEVAATCSGGDGYINGPDPDVILVTNPGYNGGSLAVNAVINDGVRYVGDNFNDQISSVNIVRGTWNFFSDPNYQGFLGQLGPGSYPLLTGSNNDNIASLFRVG